MNAFAQQTSDAQLKVVKPWMIAAILFAFVPGAFALNVAGRAPDVTLADLMTISFGFAAIALLDLKLEGAIGLAACAYLFIMILSILVNAVTDARDPIHGLASIRFFVFGFVAFVLTVTAIRSKRDADLVVNAVICCGTIFSILLLNSFWRAYSDPMDSARDVKDNTFMLGHLGAYWIAVIMPCVPLAVARFLESTKRWLFVPAILILFVALLVSMSKGAMLALTVATAIALRKYWKKLFTWHALLLMIVASGVIIILPKQVLTFPLSIFLEFADRGDTKRLDLWATAWNIFRHNPLFGVGPGGSKYFVTALDETNPHNFILASLADVGLSGTLPFLLLIGIVLKRAYQSARSPITYALLVSLCATLLHGLVEPTFVGGQEYCTVFWVIAGLSVSAYRDTPLANSGRLSLVSKGISE